MWRCARPAIQMVGGLQSVSELIAQVHERAALGSVVDEAANFVVDVDRAIADVETADIGDRVDEQLAVDGVLRWSRLFGRLCGLAKLYPARFAPPFWRVRYPGHAPDWAFRSASRPHLVFACRGGSEAAPRYSGRSTARSDTLLRPVSNAQEDALVFQGSPAPLDRGVVHPAAAPLRVAGSTLRSPLSRQRVRATTSPRLWSRLDERRGHVSVGACPVSRAPSARPSVPT